MRQSYFIILAAGVSLSAAPLELHGQAAESPRTQEVRLAYRCIDAAVSDTCTVHGTIRSLPPSDPLVIKVADGNELTVRVADVIRLDQRIGTRSRWVEGAVAGFVVGAAATLVTLNGASGQGSLCDYGRDQDAMGWAGCFGIAGGVGVVTGGIGALVGSRMKTARWRRVD